MPELNANAAGPFGLTATRPQKVRIVNGHSVALEPGQIVAFDIANEPVNWGDRASGTSLVVLSPTNPEVGIFLAVNQQLLQVGEAGYGVIRGVTKALQTVASNAGLPAVVTSGGLDDNAPAAGERIVAMNLDDGAFGTLQRCIFNGIEGFGSGI